MPCSLPRLAHLPGLLPGARLSAAAITSAAALLELPLLLPAAWWHCLLNCCVPLLLFPYGQEPRLSS